MPDMDKHLENPARLRRVNRNTRCNEPGKIVPLVIGRIRVGRYMTNGRQCCLQVELLIQVRDR